MTFAEIARKLGVSKECVWAIYKNAIRKMRIAAGVSGKGEV